MHGGAILSLFTKGIWSLGFALVRLMRLANHWIFHCERASEEPPPPDSPPLSFTGTCEENRSRGEGGWERTEPGTNWHRERTDEWI